MDLLFNKNKIPILLIIDLAEYDKIKKEAEEDKQPEHEQLLEALIEAKKTIKALHGEDSWDIYDQHSPEMKKINAAIKKSN